MSSLKNKLKLVPKSWYAWMMIPGYAGERNVPYCSPIFVTGVHPKKTGKNMLRLQFVNVFYAEGVQNFELDLRIVKHSKDYIVADLDYGKDGPDRCAVISHIEFKWIEEFCPRLWFYRHPSSVGGAAETSVSIYLSEVFGLGKSLALQDGRKASCNV